MLDGILKKLFGDKSQKDLKELSPIIDQTAGVFSELQQLSDDQLRDQSRIFKEEIISSYKMISDEVHELKQKASSENMSIQDKEALFETNTFHNGCLISLEKKNIPKQNNRHTHTHTKTHKDIVVVVTEIQEEEEEEQQQQQQQQQTTNNRGNQ